MSENVQITSLHGEPLPDVYDIKEVHRLGIWHATCHIWICVGYQYMVFQLRAGSKENFPSRWDVSSAGHIRLGETSTQAAVREIKEELNIKVDEKKLCYLGKLSHDLELKSGRYLDREWADIYLLHLPELSFSSPTEEVEDIRLVENRQWEAFTGAAENLCVPHPQEYLYLGQLIRNSPLFKL